MIRSPPRPTLSPYTTLFRSQRNPVDAVGGTADTTAAGPHSDRARRRYVLRVGHGEHVVAGGGTELDLQSARDPESTRLNNSHSPISYAERGCKQVPNLRGTT